LFLLAGVMLGMSLSCFVRMMLCVHGMALRDLRVMGALFDRSGCMMLGSFLVMLSSLFVMLGGLGVVFCNLGCSGHCSLPSHFAQFWSATESKASRVAPPKTVRHSRAKPSIGIYSRAGPALLRQETE
jgi:hypothetical protein